MRIFYLTVFVLMLALASCSNPKKPNIILFVVDDMGWTDVACFGSDLHETPNIDKLASSGMKFTNAYASCTVCSPTRASIMTGKYPARLHCTDWIDGHKKPFAKMKIPNWTMYLDLDEVTLAEALKADGYNTIHLGKWHLGEDEKYWPTNQGFDVNIGGYSAGGPKGVGKPYFSPYGNPRMTDGPEGEYLTERLANDAVSYIDNVNDKEEPFFMNFWFYNVHGPHFAKEEKVEKYKGKVNLGAQHTNPIYAAMVEHVDDAVGKVIQKLKGKGLYNNTIIIFTSDNGGLIGRNRTEKITDNTPLRHGKGGIYEGGVRVPFIAVWANKISQGKTNDTPIISADIYPTILGLTGVQGNEIQNRSFDGLDLSETLLANKELKRDAIYWHYPHYHTEGAKPYSAIRKGNWKAIEVFEEDKVELYNLADDIGESNNLADKHPEKLKELMADLNKWRKDVGAQMPTDNPNYNPKLENQGIPKLYKDLSAEEYLKILEAKKNK